MPVKNMSRQQKALYDELTKDFAKAKVICDAHGIDCPASAETDITALRVSVNQLLTNGYTAIIAPINLFAPPTSQFTIFDVEQAQQGFSAVAAFYAKKIVAGNARPPPGFSLCTFDDSVSSDERVAILGTRTLELGEIAKVLIASAVSDVRKCLHCNLPSSVTISKPVCVTCLQEDTNTGGDQAAFQAKLDKRKAAAKERKRQVSFAPTSGILSSSNSVFPEFESSDDENVNIDTLTPFTTTTVTAQFRRLFDGSATEPTAKETKALNKRLSLAGPTDLALALASYSTKQLTAIMRDAYSTIAFFTPITFKDLTFRAGTPTATVRISDDGSNLEMGSHGRKAGVIDSKDSFLLAHECRIELENFLLPIKAQVNSADMKLIRVWVNDYGYLATMDYTEMRRIKQAGTMQGLGEVDIPKFAVMQQAANTVPHDHARKAPPKEQQPRKTSSTKKKGEAGNRILTALETKLCKDKNVCIKFNLGGSQCTNDSPHNVKTYEGDKNVFHKCPICNGPHALVNCAKR
jgi:hypothetical protein